MYKFINRFFSFIARDINVSQTNNFGTEDKHLSLMKQKEQIRKLLGNNDFGSAITKMLDICTKSKLKADIVQQQGKLSLAKDNFDQSQNEQDTEKQKQAIYEVEQNKVRNYLLEILAKIK